MAANINSGPDMFWGLYSLPHLFPDKVVDVTDIADYLGKKYGGWVPSAIAYGKSGNKWIDIPVAYNGNMQNYRKTASEKAGFKAFPKTTDEFLAYAKAMKAQGTPGGMALGHASGDGNAWVHWCLWTFGGNLVDAKDKVILNSPETAKALEYAKQLSETFLPGTASWNNSSNNKAFLAGECHWTGNGCSIYAAAKAQKMEMADDIDHAYWPIGPIGKPTEFHICYPIMIMKYSKFPQASKAFIAFMMEAAQLDPWVESGGLSHTGTEILREKSDLDLGSKAYCISRRRRAYAHGGRAWLSRRKGGGGARRFRGARHVRQLLHRPR